MVAPGNLMESPMDRPASKGTDVPSQSNNEQCTDDKEELTEVPRLPSYVPLACCISGYTTLSYDSKQRQNLRSRPVSPLRPESYQNVMYTSEGGKYLLPEATKFNQNMQTEGKGLDVMNGVSGLHSPRHVASISLAQESRSFSSSIVSESYTYSSSRYSRTSTTTSSFSTNTTTTNGNSSASRLITPTKFTEQLSPSSFIVQRVERLYGPGALAQGFYSPRKTTNSASNNKSSVKILKDISSNNNDNEQIKSDSSLPVLKLLRPEFRAQLTVANRKLRTISIPEKLSSSPYEDIKPEEKRKNSSDQVDATAVLINNVTIQPQVDLKDGHYFLKILKENVDRLEKLAEEAEKEVTELENEEGCGILRAAAGKARLLVAQKLKQFEGLCYKNIKQSKDEDFPTTNEDLAGFWDMVMIQVTEVFKQFEQIEKMRKNDWKNIESIVAEAIATRPSNTPTTTPNKQHSSRPSSGKSTPTVKKSISPIIDAKLSSASKARDEARRKMIEERRKAMKEKQIKEGNTANSNETMFVL